MPYYGCSQCHRPAENSERLCGRCRTQSEQRAEKEIFQMLQFNAKCTTLDIEVRDDWRRTLWYVERLQKKIERIQQWSQSKDEQLIRLKEQISEMQAERDMEAERNVG